MKKALGLARRAKGSTSPNPAVGAVIVKGGRIVGSGKTQCCGEDHAEIQALKKAGKKSRGATMYVTLEPCCHHGRTPPCTDAIKEAGIKKVFYATADPNPRVKGKGHSCLETDGLTMHEGLLEREAHAINEDFFKFIGKKEPFIVLKYAQTIDGYIAHTNGKSKWITGEKARAEVHRLRAWYDAILVGIGTVLSDNPTLNVRWIKGRDPVRIILDSKNRLPANSKIARTASKIRTIVACVRLPRKPLPHVEYWKIPAKNGKISLKAFLKKAARENITGILVEGGAKVLSSFLKEKRADKIIIGIGNKVFGEGIHPFLENSGHFSLSDVQIKQFGDDVMVFGYPVWS